MHNIPIDDLQVLRLPVSSRDDDGNEVSCGQWIAVLVHANGMRKVLAVTKAFEHEWQAVDVLLRMLQVDLRKRLFGERGFGGHMALSDDG